ncbi:MAG: PSD1 domain-containing protein [Planctomycetales bacterium]|nr:PSD1 domain-containing protein [Planctomycetales bacterium]
MSFNAWTFVVVCSAATASLLADEPLSFEADVRPIFKTHCFQCHGEGGELSGGLDLRLRRLIEQGGDSGAAVVAGQPKQSELLARMLAGEMPPEEVALRPTTSELATIEAWIASGAIAIGPEPEDLDPDLVITPQERDYWAFRPIHRPALPRVQATELADNAIDHFLLARLEEHELTLSPITDRATLIRRLTFDLRGLPPTPLEVKRFVEDSSPAAYQQLVDRLLHAPSYGERWGRHWLDVAGYADSEGYTEEDPLRPNAYHYRDYVIHAFNSDKPFDQFIIEQLAGDELLEPPLNNLTPDQSEKLIATGFLRMAPDGTGSSSVDQALARNDVLIKTIEIVSTSLLGLTVGCAQCHNHRYDPILQKDYYALRAILEPALNCDQWLAPASRRVSLYTDADRALAAKIEVEAQKIIDEHKLQQAAAVEATFQSELSKLDASLHEPIRMARATPESERSPEQKKLLNDNPSVNVTAGSLYLYDKPAADRLQKMIDQATELRATKPPEEFVRAVWEPVDQALPETHLFHRGDYLQPTQIVAPATLTVLTSAKLPTIPSDDPAVPTSGRRLAFARWLTSPDNPLVSRVIVNRLWMHHFGSGLVPTPGDFGALGEPPTHPELLDWLAAEFISSGWSVKHIQRMIVDSRAYRQSSLRHATGDAHDADNRLYWRMTPRRLEAEVLRDSGLAISGELNAKPYGPAVPVMPDAVGQFVIGIENMSAGRPGAIIDMHGEDLRRSIYVQVRRTRPLSVFAPFDAPLLEPNCVARKSSTVSPQALLLMNSDFVLARSTNMASRLQREAPDSLAEQIELAWRLVYGVAPVPHEIVAATAFIAEQTSIFGSDPPPEVKDQTSPEPDQEALASFCHALLSSNRFLYVD